MFCTKCGQEFPDNSAACPVCGQPVNAPVQQPVAQPQPQPVYPQAQQPAGQPVYQQPVAYAPVPQPKAASSIKYDIGGFLGGFFKNPIEACTSRDKSEHFLLGLTFPLVILIVNLIFNLACKTRSAMFNLMTGGTWVNTGIGKKMMGERMTTPRAFIVFFTELLAFAVLYLIIFALYKAFKVKKVDILSTFSWVGLAFFPYAIMNLISWICTQIYYNPKGFDFINLGPVFSAVGFLFVFIVLYDYFLSKKEANGTKGTALVFALVSCAVFKLSELFLGFLMVRMFL